MDKREEAEVMSLARRLEVHEQLRNTIRDLFGGEPSFIVMIPEYSVMSTNIEPMECVTVIASALASITRGAQWTQADDSDPTTGVQ